MQGNLLSKGLRFSAWSGVLIGLFTLFCVPAYAWSPSFDEVVTEIALALKTGNAKKVSNTFASMVNLSVKREEGSYTKFQAELLLDEFFRSNKVEQLKELQRVNNSSNSYIVFSLKSNKSTYRVFVKLAQTNTKFQVVEMRLE